MIFFCFFLFSICQGFAPTGQLESTAYSVAQLQLITEQTNLLALNDAIEDAVPGTTGNSFQEVAQGVLDSEPQN